MLLQLITTETFLSSLLAVKVVFASHDSAQKIPSPLSAADHQNLQFTQVTLLLRLQASSSQQQRPKRVVFCFQGRKTSRVDMEDARWRVCGRTCGSRPAVHRLHATREEKDAGCFGRFRPPVQVCPAHFDPVVTGAESNVAFGGAVSPSGLLV